MNTVQRAAAHLGVDISDHLGVFHDLKALTSYVEKEQGVTHSELGYANPEAYATALLNDELDVYIAEGVLYVFLTPDDSAVAE